MAHYHFASTNALEQLEYVIDDLPLVLLLSVWLIVVILQRVCKFFNLLLSWLLVSVLQRNNERAIDVFLVLQSTELLGAGILSKTLSEVLC
uniref:Uncharacterized protein n=1 Tax=Physcomitrium patens TaxID=3218 RepID=A0A7I4AT63_PHYPA